MVRYEQLQNQPKEKVIVEKLVPVQPAPVTYSPPKQSITYVTPAPISQSYVVSSPGRQLNYSVANPVYQPKQSFGDVLYSMEQPKIIDGGRVQHSPIRIA